MEHQGEKNIDPSLLAKIKQAEKDGGIFLKNIPEDHVVEVHTKNSIYALAVIDKKKSKVVIQGNNKVFLQPEACYLRGSTFGGSMIKIGWIGVGMHLEANPASGGIVTTSSIKTVVVVEDRERARKLIQEACTTEPKKVTKEEAQNSISNFVHKKFPEEIRAEISRILSDFSLNGKIAVVSLLEVAHRHEKFNEAKKLLSKFFQEHWAYQAPEVRGDPAFTQQNAHYIERAYQELELPLPGQ